MPKRCQKYQINYIECRMKHGLMGKEKIENLGFSQINTWETEEQVKIIILTFKQKKKELFKKLVEIDKVAERNIMRMRGKETFDNNLYHV